uniref:Non-haem dioxygenase N-terminal domain-containing protein n=1 Tax=Kalanchoe fedtschenkoi TaxID=63787 RepID=A0A7N0VKC7_KALFE
MGAAAEVDPAYLLDPEHRPKPATAVVHGLPVIDLAEALASPTPSDLSKPISEIRDACRDWGFFQVVNHGVDAAVRDRFEAAARRFFALPLEEKRKVLRDEVNPLGYYDVEHTKNVRDWMEVFDYSPTGSLEIPGSDDPLDEALLKKINQWPENPPEFKEACEEYVRQTEKLPVKLVDLISLSLGLGADRLKGFFENETSFVRPALS